MLRNVQFSFCHDILHIIFPLVAVDLMKNHWFPGSVFLNSN